MTVAAPTIVDSQTSAGVSQTTLTVDHSTEPIADGDLMMVYIACGDRTVTAPSGWTLIEEYTVATLSYMAIYRKTADGGEENGSTDWTANSATSYTAVFHHITGAQNHVIVSTSGTDKQDTTLTFEEVEATWQDKENLFVAAACWVDDDETVSSWPGEYLHSRDTIVSGGGTNNGVGIGVSTRRLKSDSDTPSDLEITATERATCLTLVIRPSHIAPAQPPVGDRGLEVSMRVGGDWHDVGENGLYQRVPIKLKSGRSDWARTAEPSNGSLTLDNRSSIWSPANQTGAFHPDFKQGVPVRVGYQQKDAFVEPSESLEPYYTQTLYTPSDPQLDITGDTDLRFDIESTRNIGIGEFVTLGFKAEAWFVYLGRSDDGLFVTLQWDESGGIGVAQSNTNSKYFPWRILTDRTTIRITLDVSTGDVSFYWATDGVDSTDWTLVDTITTGATNLETSTNGIFLASYAIAPTETFDVWAGRLYAFKQLDGIDGTPIADLDLTSATPGAETLTGDDGLTWTVGPQARVTRTRWVFHGEVSSIPTEYGQSADQWVPLKIDGYLKRQTGIDRQPLSAIRRAYQREIVSSSVSNYYPMEEQGTGQERISSFGAVIGQLPLARIGGTPKPGTGAQFSASNKICELADGRLTAGLDGPKTSGTGELMARFLMYVDENPATERNILDITTPNGLFALYYGASGYMRIDLWRNGSVVQTGSNWGFTNEGEPVRVSLGFVQDGADIDVSITTTNADSTVTGGGTDTFTSETLAWPQQIEVNPNGQDLSGFFMGHLTIEDTVRTLDLTDDLNAYTQEPAGIRIERLCEEDGIEARIVGDPLDTTLMGPQRPKPVMKLIEEAAGTDLGLLSDASDRLAISYRTAASMKNQASKVELALDESETYGRIHLIQDISSVYNDITVKNGDGSEARAEITEGKLSSATYPNGIGRHEKSYTINTYNAAETLTGQVFSRLRLSNLEPARLSSVSVALHSPDLTDAQKQALKEIRPGDKITVSGLPDTDYPLNQIVQGRSESIKNKSHILTFNTSPAEPWDTKRWGTDSVLEEARYGAGDSILVDGEPSGSTTLYIKTLSGPVWSTDSDDTPLDILVDGVRVTVSAIVGTDRIQTFTVSATPRALAGGSKVEIADPTHWSL